MKNRRKLLYVFFCKKDFSVYVYVYHSESIYYTYELCVSDRNLEKWIFRVLF